MPCSFQLVSNFLVKNAFFGDRYFSRVFQRKNPVIKIGLSLRALGGIRAGGAFLVNVLVNLLFFADLIFSQSVQPACFKFHT